MGQRFRCAAREVSYRFSKRRGTTNVNQCNQSLPGTNSQRGLLHLSRTGHPAVGPPGLCAAKDAAQLVVGCRHETPV